MASGFVAIKSFWQHVVNTLGKDLNLCTTALIEPRFKKLLIRQIFNLLSICFSISAEPSYLEVFVNQSNQKLNLKGQT